MSRYEHDDDIMEDDEAAPDEMRNYGDYLHDDWDDDEEAFEHEQFDDDDFDDRDEFEMNDDGDFDMDDEDLPF
jgi:hypothetical protein